MKTTLKISSATSQLILIVILVFIFRIVFVDMANSIEHTYGFDLVDMLVHILSDSVGLIVAITSDIYFVFILNRHIPYSKSPVKRVFFMLLFVIVISVLHVAIAERRLIFGHSWESMPWERVFASYIAALLVNAVIVILADLVFFFRRSRIALVAESNKKRKAQYQYQQLKQQLNPHFLFNCLNNLDYLVHNGDMQRASDFIKKLAWVYRYLLSTENSVVVRLEEELAFTNMYADLLKERFTDGLTIDVNIDRRLLNRNIVPCALQLLVENAAKHNIVNKENPLLIKIYSEKGMIVVSNNFQPKINPQISTGLGLTNIEKQYRDISNREIRILQTEGEFIVKLPLL